MRRILIACSALLAATLAAGVTAQNRTGSDLPAIGSAGDSVISRDEEYQLGRMVVAGLRDQGQILDDPEINDYIQNLGSRIAAQAQESPQRFQFFVVRDARINAFALPGGFIGVNQGLITATANEAQLASVLAHEIAHVTQRHIPRSIQAQGKQGMASAAAILASILIGAVTGTPDAAMAGMAVAQGAAAQSSINFTRANEYEADRIGIGFLAAAGFDPNAMPDLFETLGRRAGPAIYQAPEFLQTHPVSANRIAESRDRAALLKPAITAESLAYSFVRERVRVLGAGEDADLSKYYAALADTRPLTPAQRYGESLARLGRGDRERAASALIELAASQPQSPMLQAALGQAQFAAGWPDLALQTLRTALDVAPRNVPLTIRYAEVLLRTGGAKQAHQLLLDLFNNVAPTPEQIRFTALAASAAGDTADAYYYMSEYHIAGGDLSVAVKQLELALADPAISAVQRARFEARSKEIREALAANRKHRDRSRPDADKMPR